MIIYIENPSLHAGKWIYKGYRSAWEEAGYEVRLLPDFSVDGSSMLDMNFPPPGEYMMMSLAIRFNCDTSKAILEKSHKSFLYTAPTSFPGRWCSHPNYIFTASPEAQDLLNKSEKAKLWTFADTHGSHWSDWKPVETVPLAFDSINYVPRIQPQYKEFDVSFVGGWANNGFNEKKKIILETFAAFKDSGLKCGFFINKNLSHQQECDLLANSRTTLNIHDEYQRVLGYDTNERTFKSLGLNGLLISDTVDQLNNLFPTTKTSLNPDELVEITKNYLSLTEKELNDIKDKNRQDILDNHCYTNRVEQLLKL